MKNPTKSRFSDRNQFEVVFQGRDGGGAAPPPHAPAMDGGGGTTHDGGCAKMLWNMREYLKFSSQFAQRRPFFHRGYRHFLLGWGANPEIWLVAPHAPPIGGNPARASLSSFEGSMVNILLLLAVGWEVCKRGCHLSVCQSVKSVSQETMKACKRLSVRFFWTF